MEQCEGQGRVLAAVLAVVPRAVNVTYLKVLGVGALGLVLKHGLELELTNPTVLAPCTG